MRRFCEECGFPDDGYLPVSYPHVLCSLMNTRLISQPGFPFPVFGVMHVRHRIQQWRRIELDESLEFHSRVGAPRGGRSGYEYDIDTECRIDGERVWSEVTTFLVAVKTGLSNRVDPGPAVPDAPHSIESWTVDAQQGWRFARASDDFNPIHLSRRIARVFGLRSSLAHGMWVLGRSLARIDALDGADALEVTAYFRRPLWLPASGTRTTADFVHETKGDTTTFAVLRPADRKPYMVATAARN